jgi:hypothetical protein
MKKFIFAFFIAGIISAQNNEDELPPVSTPPNTPRQIVTAEEHFSLQRDDAHTTPGTGTGSNFIQSVESYYEPRESSEMIGLPPPLPFSFTQSSTPISQYQPIIDTHIGNIIQMIRSSTINIADFLSEIDELAMHSMAFPIPYQAGLLREITNHTNPWLRANIIIRFLNTLFLPDDPVLSLVNNPLFREDILRELCALEGAESYLRHLEQQNPLDLQAFRNIALHFTSLTRYITDPRERELLGAIANSNRFIIRERLIIRWLETRFVIDEVIKEFEDNLRLSITQLYEENIENPVELQQLANEARLAGFDDLAQTMESTRRYVEAQYHSIIQQIIPILLLGYSQLFGTFSAKPT